MSDLNHFSKVYPQLTNKNGVIDPRKLNKAINFEANYVKSKAGLKPGAQAYKTCGLESDISKAIRRVEHAIEVTKVRNRIIHAILLFQYETGCRISEVLGIFGSNITKNRMVVIEGLKGSRDRSFSVSSNWGFWSEYQGMPGKVFECYSRFYVYREYKKLGLSFNFGIYNKMSVTHALRHIMGRSMQESNISKALIQKQLGHVSEKSTDSYLDA